MPVVCARTNATLPVAHLLAGLRDANGRKDAIDTRHNRSLGSLGALEGSEETDAAADGHVSAAAGQDTHVGIGDGSSGDGARIA